MIRFHNENFNLRIYFRHILALLAFSIAITMIDDASAAGCFFSAEEQILNDLENAAETISGYEGAVITDKVVNAKMKDASKAIAVAVSYAHGLDHPENESFRSVLIKKLDGIGIKWGTDAAHDAAHEISDYDGLLSEDTPLLKKAIKSVEKDNVKGAVGFKWAGRVFIVVSIVDSGWTVYTAPDKGEAIAEQVGAWTFAELGAVGATEACVATGAGALVSPLCGVVGGVVGGIYGSKIGKQLWEGYQHGGACIDWDSQIAGNCGTMRLRPPMRHLVSHDDSLFTPSAIPAPKFLPLGPLDCTRACGGYLPDECHIDYAECVGF